MHFIRFFVLVFIMLNHSMNAQFSDIFGSAQNITVSLADVIWGVCKDHIIISSGAISSGVIVGLWGCLYGDTVRDTAIRGYMRLSGDYDKEMKKILKETDRKIRKGKCDLVQAAKQTHEVSKKNQEDLLKTYKDKDNSKRDKYIEKYVSYAFKEAKKGTSWSKSSEDLKLYFKTAGFSDSAIKEFIDSLITLQPESQVKDFVTKLTDLQRSAFEYEIAIKMRKATKEHWKKTQKEGLSQKDYAYRIADQYKLKRADSIKYIDLALNDMPDEEFFKASQGIF